MNLRKYVLCCILSLCLATLMLVGCSDQVLNPDGSISTRGEGQKTQDGQEQTEASTVYETPGPGQLTLGTEAATGGGSLEIGGNDPEEMFKDAPHVMHVEFLQTGESDCILLRMDETVVLVDTADSDDYGALKAKLSGYGIDTIHYLILTHFDNDHIGSAAGVVKDFNVEQIYAPDYVRDSGLYRSMMSAIEAKAGTTLHRVTEDVEITLDYGRLWLNPTHLYPAGEVLGHDSPDAAVEENNFSLITSVYFGEVSMLLLGDAEEDRMAEFNALFAEGEYPAYTLVKTPHHGGYDKNLGACLTAVRSRYCVVTTDTEDKVEAGLVTSMRASGAAAYYTYNGEIMFSTDGSITKRLLTQK